MELSNTKDTLASTQRNYDDILDKKSRADLLNKKLQEDLEKYSRVDEERKKSKKCLKPHRVKTVIFERPETIAGSYRQSSKRIKNVAFSIGNERRGS
ncbi:hypothetical protein CEXT_502111 [Caerostris extrusa]|uniref:Uncharacterized protein n=1 Tax=Caerostris extrusa TaxID=172846 RepID=A0AAV4MWK5_CAEEX|nr:hypothetical protein CEXT_502111 [Caerostris extrusa]